MKFKDLCMGMYYRTRDNVLLKYEGMLDDDLALFSSYKYVREKNNYKNARNPYILTEPKLMELGLRETLCVPKIFIRIVNRSIPPH